MRRFLGVFLKMTVLLIAIGCGGGQSGGPFGPPKVSPLLVPFAGDWTFEFEKTLEARVAAGASAEAIAKLRKFCTENPQIGRIHPDLKINGDVAVSARFQVPNTVSSPFTSMRTKSAESVASRRPLRSGDIVNATFA